jgi:hypothetical protein
MRIRNLSRISPAARLVPREKREQRDPRDEYGEYWIALDHGWPVDASTPEILRDAQRNMRALGISPPEAPEPATSWEQVRAEQVQIDETKLWRAMGGVCRMRPCKLPTS